MTRNKWKTQYQHIETASALHNKVRSIFTKDPFFSRMKCYQEINVKDLIESYPYTSHHYDWYIEELNLVIELHGQQHYKVVNYGNIGYEEAQRAFLRMKDRDNDKKTAALAAGYTYKEIPFHEEKRLTAQRIKEIIFYEDI